jgi:hypothetical protein
VCSSDLSHCEIPLATNRVLSAGKFAGETDGEADEKADEKADELCQRKQAIFFT